MIRISLTAVTRRAGEILKWSGYGRRGEEFKGRDGLQQYGFASSPKAGAEGVAVLRGNHYVLVATDDRRYTVDLAEGEVALYTDEGDRIHFQRGRKILVQSGGEVDITAPTIKINGNLEVNGAITSNGNITADGTMQGKTGVTAGQGGASVSLLTHTHLYLSPAGPPPIDTLPPTPGS